MVDDESKHGFLLEWFAKGEEDIAGSFDLAGITAERVSELVGDPDVDQVMCSSYELDGDALVDLTTGIDIDIDPSRYDYFVSGWAETGFRTPGGLYPPPRVAPPFIVGAVKIRPQTRE